MNELINNDLIKVDMNTLTVSARDLHEGLGIGTKFTMWFDRMCEYGFTENDYTIVWSDPKNGNAVKFEKNVQYMSAKGFVMDAQISIEMAKQICMLQRTDKGKQYRQYFLDLEKAWNTPEQVMARALKLADKTINDLKYHIEAQNKQIETQKEEINTKQEMINGLTDNIDIYKKIDIINRICKKKHGNYANRYIELYKCFKEANHIDLELRCKNYNKKQTKKKDKISVIQYASSFNHIDDLFDCCIKLYETETKKLIKELMSLHETN